MSVPPHVLRDRERQPFRANASLGRQAALEAAPEAFQTVAMHALTTATLALVMLHQPVDLSFGSDPRGEPQGIGTDDRATPHAPANQGEQRRDGQIGHHLRPHLSPATEDPEDGGLARPTSPFAAPHPAGMSPSAPATADIGVVPRDCAMEDRRHVGLQQRADARQCAQNPLPMQAGFLGHGGGTEPTHVASPQGFALMPRQAQRQPRLPIVPAARTPALVAANDPGSRVSASWTTQSSCHVPSLPNQVAGMRLYP
jgi:hypothetical protein